MLLALVGNGAVAGAALSGAASVDDPGRGGTLIAPPWRLAFPSALAGGWAGAIPSDRGGKATRHFSPQKRSMPVNVTIAQSTAHRYHQCCTR